ncbi:hypothetical protein Taro_004746 [Colocasia esculenta]|uniref:Uncharacterized protein n=1 Tax=Colocasia esculenta TaxID=4460 RepID=A0A843TN94_COLES|nr:hypothetical protein [Colocasia esculenta]
MTSTSPPENASIQRTTRNQYPHKSTAKHEPESTTPPHGTDYWFMTPVSNPDNTAQEQPLSLAVTNVRSNCRSTTQVESKNYGD